MDAKGVLEFSAKNGAKILDLRFIDLPGVWQHVSYPIGELTEDSLQGRIPDSMLSTRFGDGLRSTNPTCCSFRTRIRHLWIRSERNQH